jgi:hypothetical protein
MVITPHVIPYKSPLWRQRRSCECATETDRQLDHILSGRPGPGNIYTRSSPLPGLIAPMSGTSRERPKLGTTDSNAAHLAAPIWWDAGPRISRPLMAKGARLGPIGLPRPTSCTRHSTERAFRSLGVRCDRGRDAAALPCIMFTLAAYLQPTPGPDIGVKVGEQSDASSYERRRTQSRDVCQAPRSIEPGRARSRVWHAVEATRRGHLPN